MRINAALLGIAMLALISHGEWIADSGNVSPEDKKSGDQKQRSYVTSSQIRVYSAKKGG